MDNSQFKYKQELSLDVRLVGARDLGDITESELTFDTSLGWRRAASIIRLSGFMSLLIETMWSDREWFLKRTQADDYNASVQQAIESSSP